MVDDSLYADDHSLHAELPCAYENSCRWRCGLVLALLVPLASGCSLMNRLDVLNGHISSANRKLDILYEANDQLNSASQTLEATNRRLDQLYEMAQVMDGRLATIEKLAKRLGGLVQTEAAPVARIAESGR